jgi:nonsense-mediated mRNA decay protein 3
VNDASFDKLESHTVPDVVLVKKYYDRSERKRRRIWKLKHLAEEDTALVTDTRWGVSIVTGPKLICFFQRDYNEFLDDLEEDPDLRHNVNIFKDSTKQILVDSGDDVDEAVPRITLAEMLDDLVIDDVEMTEQ